MILYKWSLKDSHFESIAHVQSQIIALRIMKMGIHRQFIENWRFSKDITNQKRDGSTLRDFMGVKSCSFPMGWTTQLGDYGCGWNGLCPKQVQVEWETWFKDDKPLKLRDIQKDKPIGVGLKVTWGCTFKRRRVALSPRAEKQRSREPGNQKSTKNPTTKKTHQKK